MGPHELRNYVSSHLIKLPIGVKHQFVLLTISALEQHPMKIPIHFSAEDNCPEVIGFSFLSF
jgi:hypothetical protein